MSQKTCFHCGDDVIGKGISFDEKAFCCNGCKSVYHLLSSSDLGSFYSIENQAGQRPNKVNDHKYAFLEVEEIRQKFIEFEDDDNIHTTLFLPQIHCSSCIYLLENIQKIEPGVVSCQVNFTKREASLVLSKKVQLSDFALLLDKIGYAPNFGDRKQQNKKRNNQYLYKLGVAGFAFGSIMLWSFPEYLGIENDNPEFRNFTSYLSFAVSIPVILYSAREYLISAYKAIKFKTLNLDVPISIGILALYIQSCYNIFAGLGPGYMDSFAGFIFFLLIGKWFQNKTYDTLSFDRDYTSYFPVAVTISKNGNEEITEIDKVKVDDLLIIRNQEVLPSDSILESESAKIDYSFVTGESAPVKKVKGDLIYAGGKLIGKKSSFRVKKESSRSHLTQLWNESSSQKEDQLSKSKTDKLSLYFLAGVLIIAFLSSILWFYIDASRITEIVVSILIVACPCALALSRPFTYGNIMRILGRKGLYLKSAAIIEDINSVTDVVFDKTGTLTHSNNSTIHYEGESISQEDQERVLILANSSTHPLSRALVMHLKQDSIDSDMELNSFEEISGKGIKGLFRDDEIKIGSSSFVGAMKNADELETVTYISVNNRVLGKYVFESSFRDGIESMIDHLSSNYQIHILSGDNTKDQEFFDKNLSGIKEVHFNQTPQDKFNYIQKLQNKGRRVMMIGDGLNDSGALKSANVGIAISEDVFRFSPSSDAIIEASKLTRLMNLLQISKFSKTVLFACFSFSIIYNIIGLFFAIGGNLTPLIAAILMPLSSISVVVISSVLSNVKN